MTMPDSVSGVAVSDATISGVAGRPRDVNYDLLRVVAMCLVIGVHVINNYMPVKMTLAGSAETVRSVLFALFMVCNPLFIMVSGRFNLTCDAGRLGSTRSSGNLPGSGSDARAGGGAGQADPSSLAPYVRYYYKRFISLIVPYLLYAGGMGFVAYLVIDHRSVGGAVSGTLFDLFSGYDDSVYWFVFMLAGFVLATPFLAAMMRAIGRSGAWLLIGLAAAVAAAEQICNLAGYPLTFLQSFPWRGLLVYYLLGFVLEYYP
ncbi:acyltransferase, partial [Bifidobacterium longum]